MLNAVLGGGGDLLSKQTKPWCSSPLLETDRDVAICLVLTIGFNTQVGLFKVSKLSFPSPKGTHDGR